MKRLLTISLAVVLALVLSLVPLPAQPAMADPVEAKLTAGDGGTDSVVILDISVTLERSLTIDSGDTSGRN